MAGSEQRLEERNYWLDTYKKRLVNPVKGSLYPVPSHLFPQKDGKLIVSDAFRRLIKGTAFKQCWETKNYGEAFMKLDEEVRLAAFAELRYLVPESLRYGLFYQVVSSIAPHRLIHTWLVKEMLELLPPPVPQEEKKNEFLDETPSKLLEENGPIAQILFSK